MAPETTETARVWTGDDEADLSVTAGTVAVVERDPAHPECDSTDAVWLPPGDRARLSAMERNVLEARVAALERAVEQKDDQLQAVVDRYEAVIEARESEYRNERERDADGVEITFESERRGRVERVADAVRAAVSRFF